MRSHVKASSAGSTPAHRNSRSQALALFCLAVAAALTLSASPALAAKIHPYTGTSFGPDGAAGSETFANVQGVAVDQTTEEVYVYDAGAGKVYKFDSAGEPVNFSALTGNAIEGAGGTGAGENGIAVAPAGSPGGTAGDIYVARSTAVLVYAPSGEMLGELTAEGKETCGVATDPAGHVFVGIYTSPSSVREYIPSANPVTSGDQSGESTAALPEICNVAADGLGNVYAANYAGSSGTVKLAGLSSPSAGPLDPSATTLAVDPSNNDVYADRGSVVAQYDSAGNLLGSFGSGQLSGSDGLAVNATSGEVYVGGGASHTVEVFGPAIAIPDVSAESIGAISGSEATLLGRVNAEGLPVTECIFEYGTSTEYGSTKPCEGAIPADESDHQVTAVVSGLTVSTTYHFRIVVANANGTNRSGDQAFSVYAATPSFKPCPNDPLRSGSGANLSDCRAYEQATPVDKHGGSVSGGINLTQASADGNRITFSDPAGLPSTGGSTHFPVYLASRGAGAWTSNGTLPLTKLGDGAETLGWDDEIAAAASSLGSGGIYLNDTATGTFQLAAPTPSNPFPSLAGFADDTAHLIFESESVLAPGAVAGHENLYDLDHGAITLAGRIPASPATACDDTGAPACVPAPEGSFAGSYETQGNEGGGGASHRYYTQSTISDDGSKVFFTTRDARQLYVREDGTATTQVSASQASTPDPNGPKPAAFMAATPDGSEVFFTSCEQLTDDSTAVSTAAETCTTEEQGQDLYAYDTNTGNLTDLTVDSNVSDPQRAGVIGVLGTSADGSYVYFAANGELASGASPGSCPIVGGYASGTCNLYLSHAGTITFVAPLDRGTDDFKDWIPKFDIGLSKVKESRVAADGTLLFGSTQSLSGYDNTLVDASKNCAANAGNRCFEIYRYSPAGELNCVSCNPTGAVPTGSVTLESVQAAAFSQPPHTALLTRNISLDGNRAFFDSPDPLVAADANGVVDPYEWEAEGTGSCESAEVNGGCLYLLSSGTSPEPSLLGDVSASGEDAFFFTGQSLVPADKDSQVDVYDARVGGGLASQHPPAAEPPCLGEACKGASSVAPSDSTAGSATFRGPGNQHEKPAKPCQKHSKKKCKKSKKHKKSRAAHTNRGGSK